jgi:hypothetical protein
LVLGLVITLIVWLDGPAPLPPAFVVTVMCFVPIGGDVDCCLAARHLELM